MSDISENSVYHLLVLGHVQITPFSFGNSTCTRLWTAVQFFGKLDARCMSSANIESVIASSFSKSAYGSTNL